jgi:molecular chaperone GrpE
MGKKNKAGQEGKISSENGSSRNDTTGEMPGEKKGTDNDEAAHGFKEEDVNPEQEKESLEMLLANKIKEQEDKYLRLAAEFDNYRKRTLREKADLTKYAGEEIFSDLLPVVDDLDRAVDAMNNTQDIVAIRKGIDLIYGKFRDFLGQKGIKEIMAKGTEFNTDLHEAVTKIPAPSKKDRGKIIDVIQKGYLMNDKVIRYAKVVVGE